jgi:diacylglycerol kinase (ATP)
MWSIRPNIGRSVPSRAVRIAFSANPRSGGGFDPEPLAQAMREQGAEVAIHGCDDDDLERIAHDPPDRIAVAGGDGTIGPAAELAGRLGIPLGVIAAGTANDFVRANDLPEDPLEAARLVAAGTETRELELGTLADGRPFVNAASAGLAAKAARHASPFKRVLGPLAYAAGALRAAATEAPMRCTVRIDGETHFEGGAWQVIVAVTGAFGGGSDIGAADPVDGVLDVAVLPAGSRLALARRAWGLRRGTVERQGPVVHGRGRVVETELPRDAELNVDGEIRESGLERATVERAAYALIVG